MSGLSWMAFWNCSLASAIFDWFQKMTPALKSDVASAGPPDAPRPERLVAGAPVTVDGRPWSVASLVQARLLAAEGELQQPPPADRPVAIADLRNAADEVGTLEAGDPQAVHWSVGRSVALSELKMSGLREGAAEKALKAQGTPCPNCGAPLNVTLANTQSVVCASCKSVVDLSQGIGPAMAHYAQERHADPAIPIGTVGRLPIPSGAPVQPWQVVGYMERMELMGEDDDVAEAWREYLVYNRTEGFAFLVDTNEGWSVVRVLTGAPRVRGDAADWQGTSYRRRWSYASVVTYVVGEFYWRVERDQRTEHQDYEGVVNGHKVSLSLEHTPGETTWSMGESIPAPMVAAAFGLQPQAARFERDGPAPGGLRINWWMLILLLVVVVILLAMCSHDPCRGTRDAFGAGSLEYQQCRARAGSGYHSSGWAGGTGGAWGGFSSSGGGHK